MRHRHLILSSLVLASLPYAQADSDINVTFDGGISTHLIDRGETLAKLNSELAITAETDFAIGSLYGSVYRITPLGDDDVAFDEEVDYTIGYAFELPLLDGDISANYLTYPGNNADASTELAGSIEFGLPLNPSLTGFYDVDFEDAGLEGTLSSQFGLLGLSTYGLARVGIVEFGDGGNYNYAGLEAGIGFALSDFAELNVYARADVSDEDTFVDQVTSGAVSRITDHGESIGVSISVTPF